MHTEPSLDTERTPVRPVGYEILSELSASGAASTYLARRSEPIAGGELVIIKRLRPEIVLEAQFAEAFVSASRAALSLEHPNVVRTLAVTAEGADYHIVEEFLDGKSLHRLWRGDTTPPLPRELHVWILTQVLSGLHFAHEHIHCTPEGSRGFVHQIVSPSRIFITYGGEVKLSDFGLGASFGATLGAPAGRANRQLAYAAPEQCLGAPIDRRTDVFAVGVMLWEALTGRNRWNGHSDAEMFLERVQGGEPPVAPLAPATPPALVDICERALAHDPEQRFQSALEFSQALHGYLKTAGWSGGTQQLCLLVRGQLEVSPDSPAKGSCGGVSQEQLSHPSSAELRASMPTGLTHTMPVPVGETEATLQRVVALMAILPTLAARWRRLPMLALGVALAGCALAPILIWHSEESSPMATVSAPVAPASPDTLSGTKARESIAVSHGNQAAQLTLSVNVSPPQALLRLDGRPISNPYFELHEAEHGVHRLSVSLAGYEPFEKDIPFDANVDWSIVLSPVQERGRAESPNGALE